MKQYEEDKQSALAKQRQEYEKQVQQLKIAMTPSTPHPPHYPFDSRGGGNHISNNNSINGINNGNLQGISGGYGNINHTSRYLSLQTLIIL